jgi:subtilisin-like proprotein convertase family protein
VSVTHHRTTVHIHTPTHQVLELYLPAPGGIEKPPVVLHARTYRRNEKKKRHESKKRIVPEMDTVREMWKRDRFVEECPVPPVIR